MKNAIVRSVALFMALTVLVPPAFAAATVTTDLGDSSPYVTCAVSRVSDDRWYYSSGFLDETMPPSYPYGPNQGTWGDVHSHMVVVEQTPGDYTEGNPGGYTNFPGFATGAYAGRHRTRDVTVYSWVGWNHVGYERVVNYLTVDLPASNGYCSASLEWTATLLGNSFTDSVEIAPSGKSVVPIVLWPDYYPLDDNAPIQAGYSISKPHLKVTTKNAEVKSGVDKLAEWNDPINSINGAVTITATDIVVPAPGIPLAWSRRYDGAAPSAAGSLGPRWASGQGWRICETNAVYCGVTNRWLLLLADGISRWKPLAVSNDGHETADTEWTWGWTSANGAYTVTRPGGFRYRFDTNGLLAQVTDAFSNEVTYSYTNLSGSSAIQRMEHGDGRALLFEYDISNRLSRVSASFTNLSVNYGYTDAGLLTNVFQSGDASARTTRYAWDTSASVITQTTDNAGTSTAWEYSDGRGARSYVGTGRWYEVKMDYSAQSQNRSQILQYRGDTNIALYQEYDPARHVVVHTSERWPEAMFQWDMVSGSVITNAIIYYGGDSWGVYSNNPCFVAEVLPLLLPAGSSGNCSASREGWSGTRYVRDDYGVITGIETHDSDPNVAAWSKSSLAYDANHRLTNSAFGYMTTPTNAWTFSWNTNWDTLASVTDPENNRMEWEYTNGAVSVARSFPATNQAVETRYAYTTNGLLAAVTNPNGHWAAFDYNAYGYPTQAVSEVGLTNWMDWDALGHLTALRLPSGNYDTNEPPNMIPRTFTFEPNELGWVRRITRPDGQSETFAFDGVGNLTNHVDAAGRTNLFTWLPTRKLASTTRFLSTGGSNTAVTVGLDYDQQMNVVKVSDELGRAVETYKLDLQDRPIEVTNVESQNMTIAYALGDRVRSIIRFDGTTNTFAYDSAGNISTAAYPSATIAYRYLKNDLLMTATKGAGTVSNAYDGANRLILSRVAGLIPQSVSIAYGLDAEGNPTNTQAAGIDYSVSRSFDAGERLAILSAGAVGATYSYSGINGLLESVAYTNGLTCSYSYNDLDQLTALTWTDASNNVLRSRDYSYTLAGMISRVDMEDGGKVEYTYDSLDRLTGEKRSDPYGQVLAWDLYEYDLAGNRTRKTILDASSNTLLAVNSALSTGNRLASWTVPETNLMARFPVAGHASEPIGTNDRFGALWVSNAAPGGMSVKPGVEGTNFWVHDFTVGMGTQQIVAAIRDMAGNIAYTTNTVIPSVLTNGTYQYSAAGCLTNIAYAGKDVTQTLRMTWDGQYQLTAVSTGAVVESYQYDAFGRRVMTASGGVTNWHVYDGVQVIADLNGTGAVVRTYVWGPGIDNLIAMTACGATTNTFYAIKDHLGSILAMTDASGQIVEQYRYDAWGRTTVFDASGNPLTTSAIGNRYCWQGREYSWKTGLYNFRARWYDPVTGRWLSNDPIGISGGLNQYVFCANNPVNFRDPLGLCKDNDSSEGNRWWPWLLLGGVKQNISVNTPYGELSWRSPISLIEKALREAKTPGAKNALRGLLKVAKRGGTGGTTATRMGGPLLWWLPGLMSDAEVIGGAIGRGESLTEGYQREFEDAGPYILTPIGVIPNVWWHGGTGQRQDLL